MQPVLLSSFLFIMAGATATLVDCQLNEMIAAAASKYPYFVEGRRYTLNTALVRAIIHQESGGNPTARSAVGARGLMQIMPQTAELLKCDYSKIEDPQTNIDCGVKFVAALLTYTKGDLLKAISGYNGGTHSTEKSVLLGGRIADNPETKAYVKSVLNLFEGFKRQWPLEATCKDKTSSDTQRQQGKKKGLPVCPTPEGLLGPAGAARACPGTTAGSRRSDGVTALPSEAPAASPATSTSSNGPARAPRPTSALRAGAAFSPRAAEEAGEGQGELP